MAFPWAALAYLAPTLLGGLFGKGDSSNKREEYMKWLFSPENMRLNADKLYPMLLNSPGFSQAQRNIWASGNQLQTGLNASLGARGLGTSGIGAVASPLARSATGFQLGNLNSSAYSQAMEQAMKLIMGQAQGIGQTPLAPNYTNELFGAGLGAFGSVFNEWMKSKYGFGSTPD